MRPCSPEGSTLRNPPASFVAYGCGVTSALTVAGAKKSTLRVSASSDARTLQRHRLPSAQLRRESAQPSAGNVRATRLILTPTPSPHECGLSLPLRTTFHALIPQRFSSIKAPP